MEGRKACRLSPCALAVAMGITWSLAVLIIGLAAMNFDYGKPFVELFSSLYLGYGATLKGSMIGALWALIDGFIAAVIFAWIYNFTLRCCGAMCSMCCKKPD